jgi:Sulfotransferase family
VKLNPDLQYLNLLRDTVFRPVFIMGDHRSGTTLLYRLLDQTECFNVVRAYHIIRYGAIVSNYLDQIEDRVKLELSAYFSQLGVTDRMIDGVAVTPDLPEEYGFVLGAAYRSPLTPRNLPRFVELCKKVQFVSRPDVPLLLKNPWDYFLNYMYVKKEFPQAKFIFIHRDPIYVINSQLRAVRALLKTRNAYLALISRWYARLYERPLQRLAARAAFSARTGLGLYMTTRHVVQATNYYLQYVGSLSNADYITIRYEDLCRSPAASVTQVLEFFGLEPPAGRAYSSLIRPRPVHLLEEVTRAYDQVTRQLQPYLSRHGY